MSNSQVSTVVATETMVVPASAFITREVVAFERSHTRLYLAILLDVIHSHKAVAPRGYPAMLATLAPNLRDLPKYCTVIKPAMASKHAQTLKEFPATAQGLNDAVKWYTNQASIGGYTLSHADMVSFFKGSISAKAKAAILSAANEQKQALDLLANQDDKGAVSAMPQISTSLVSEIVVQDRGPAIDQGYTNLTLVVSFKDNEAAHVTGCEQLGADRLMQAIAHMQAQLASMQVARAMANDEVAA